jgi:hypothetical protein
VSITVGGKTTRRFVMDGTTVVVKATPAKPSDITSGSRIVWKAKSGQQTVADEVIVLTSDAKLGTDVVSATPTSMTIKENGKNVTVDTSGATVEKAEAAKATDIATGDKVLAQTRRTNASTLSAIEVIVLPSSSKFVV